MPEGFDKCSANGGKIITETLSGGRYRHVCILGSKRWKGHIKKKKSTKRTGR